GRHTSTAPTTAPANSAAASPRALSGARFPVNALTKGPTGLMNPGPPMALLVNRPNSTANAQAVVITIHPAFWAFDRLSRTAATTPSPRTIRIIVPKNSPRYSFTPHRGGTDRREAVLSATRPAAS